MEDVRCELQRLMEIGKQFRRFSFTCLEMDEKLDGEAMVAFYETFRQCASEASKSPRSF
jgi:hypothetical protein